MSKKYKYESKEISISDEEYMRKKEVLTSFFSDDKYMPMTKKQIDILQFSLCYVPPYLHSTPGTRNAVPILVL